MIDRIQRFRYRCMGWMGTLEPMRMWCRMWS